jgi:hypothetical protein
MKKLLILLTFICINLNTKAQNSCYNVIEDFSGLDNSSHFTELEQAACELRESMPLVFRDSFKVFDFGYYVFTKDTKSGNDPIFKKAIEKAKSQSKYYILFGKESSSDGIYTNFWFDMNLPRTKRFACHVERYWSDLNIKYRILANTLHNKNNKDFNSYHNVEIAVMDSLAHYIHDLKDCCIESETCSECVFNIEDIRSKLKSDHFFKSTIVPSDLLLNQNYDAFENVEVNANIKLKNYPNLSNELSSLITTSFNANDHVKAYIYDDFNICNSLARVLDETNTEKRIVILIDKEKQILYYNFYLPCNLEIDVDASIPPTPITSKFRAKWTPMSPEQRLDYEFLIGIYKKKNPNCFNITAQSYAYYKVCISEPFHATMSGAGFICDICDLADGVIYLLEGDYKNALLSSIAVVPVYGSPLKTTFKTGIEAISSSKNIMVLVFSKYGVRYFGRATQLATSIGKIPGKAAHHLIPWELFEKKFDKLPAIQKLVESGFHPNEFANGLNVAQTVNSKLWNGKIVENVFHGNHPNYTLYVESELKKISDEYGDNANAIAQEVMNKLLPKLKAQIKDAETFILKQNNGWTLDKYYIEKFLK